MEQLSYAEVENRFLIEAEQPRALKLSPEFGSKLPLGEVNEGAFFLLFQQELILEEEPVRFSRSVLQLVDERGVQNYSQVQFDFEPSYETLIVHRIGIWRDGRFLSKSERSRFQLLRRESALERQIFDGRYTVNIVLDDVRAGDVLDYEHSVLGNNPVFDGRVSANFYTQWVVPVKRSFIRISLPQDRSLGIKCFPGSCTVNQKIENNRKIITYEAENVSSLVVDDGIPGWAFQWPRILVSEFCSWKEVADWAEQQFLASEDELPAVRKLAEELTNAEPTNEGKLKNLVEFVQNEVRYTGIQIGSFSHRPNPLGVIVQRRFGDCKDKSQLLVHLLRSVGFKAHVALVNSYATRDLANLLASPLAFDHAVVCLEESEVKIIDATLSGQFGPFANRFVADYGVTLRIGAGDTDLLKVHAKVHLCRVVREDHFEVEKYHLPIKLKTKVSKTGWEAERDLYSLRAISNDQLQKNDAEYFTSLFGNLEVLEKFDWKQDEANGSISASGSYLLKDFQNNPQAPEYYLLDFVAYSMLTRLPGCRSVKREYPLELAYPLEVEHQIEVVLPGRADVKNSETKIDSKSFQFVFRVERKKRIVRLSYRLKLLKDHISVADYAEERQNLERARALCSYRISKKKVSKVEVIGTILFFLFLISLALFLDNRDRNSKANTNHGRSAVQK